MKFNLVYDQEQVAELVSVGVYQYFGGGLAAFSVCVQYLHVGFSHGVFWQF